MSRLVSYSQRTADISPAEFLHHAQGVERCYWNHGAVIFAGFGVAAELMAWGKDRFQTIRHKAHALFRDAVVVGDEHLAAPRLFGGFAFRDDFAPDNTWSVFTPAHFILPHYQLIQTHGETWLTINAQIQPDENPQDILPQLQEALQVRCEMLTSRQTKGFSPSLFTERGQGGEVAVNYPMPYETWERIITEATHEIKMGELQKVVLSRVCEIQFAERLHAETTLPYLNERYPECYRFLFEPRPYHAFFGATPELLARVEDQKITTMGLAGSVKRGATSVEDEIYAQQLLNDPKELHEHALVVQALRQKLTHLTDELHIPDSPEIYRLSNIQHLHTPIQGHLKQDTGILPVIETLHPTPALGGAPRELAMDFIRKAEPVPRGWYAAPIGWIDHRLDGEFGVAIRSAVSQHERVWLYAGAGIVGDSIPQKEWDETALKLKPMLNALGIGEKIHV